MWWVVQQFAPPVWLEKCTSGWPLPARSRPIECSVQREPGSVSLGLDCQIGLPAFSTAARSSAGVPLVCATTASNSLKLLVLVASRFCASSHAFVSWAADGNAVASTAAIDSAMTGRDAGVRGIIPPAISRLIDPLNYHAGLLDR